MSPRLLFGLIAALLVTGQVSSDSAEGVAGGPGDATDDCSLLQPEVQDALRKELEKDNCIRELEVVEPGDIKRAARLFHRDGFVVVKDVLTTEQNSNLASTCKRLANDIVANDPQHIGNRGPKRWSLGAASKTGHLLHDPEWAKLIDLPTLTPILKEIFGNDDYLCRGARGDFNLPGAVYQPLHSDVSRDWLLDNTPTEFSDTGHLNYRDLPVFHVVANFVLQDLNNLNAPIRQIPMTQKLQSPIPLLDDEPLWMKRSTVCPLSAGSAILRDPRAWHGGTPNLSDSMRCLANVEYYAYWYRYSKKEQSGRVIPRDVYEKLSPFAQKISREIVALPGETLDLGMKNNTSFIMSDHEQCYYKLGLSEKDLDDYKSRGQFYNYELQTDVIKQGFYGRLKREINPQTAKDEL